MRKPDGVGRPKPPLRLQGTGWGRSGGRGPAARHRATGQRQALGVAALMLLRPPHPHPPTHPPHTHPLTTHPHLHPPTAATSRTVRVVGVGVHVEPGGVGVWGAGKRAVQRLHAGLAQVAGRVGGLKGGMAAGWVGVGWGRAGSSAQLASIALSCVAPVCTPPRTWTGERLQHASPAHHHLRRQHAPAATPGPPRWRVAPSPAAALPAGLSCPDA